MTLLTLIAILKALAWVVPLSLLLRDTRWRWLVGGLVLYVVLNAATAAGASRLAVLVISLASQILLTVHVFDVSRFRKPE